MLPTTNYTKELKLTVQQRKPISISREIKTNEFFRVPPIWTSQNDTLKQKKSLEESSYVSALQRIGWRRKWIRKTPGKFQLFKHLIFFSTVFRTFLFYQEKWKFPAISFKGTEQSDLFQLREKWIVFDRKGAQSSIKPKLFVKKNIFCYGKQQWVRKYQRACAKLASRGSQSRHTGYVKAVTTHITRASYQTFCRL